jgi:dihydrolipoamide dehydrogenase
MDAELAKPLLARLKKQFEAIHVKTMLKGGKKSGKGVEIEFESGGKTTKETFDRVLVSIGRRPNSRDIGIENTKAKLDERGFLIVDEQRKTTDPKIYAIGDVAGDPMLAHKASHEGKVAVDAILGKPVAFEPAAIPAVVYTDPEVAWCGLTEQQAKDAGLTVTVKKFPWAGNGRAVSMGRTEGLTKMIFDAKTQRILGMGIVGPHAGDLISEGCFAVEMAATAEEIAATIHPHPSTGETLMEAAESMSGGGAHG